MNKGQFDYDADVQKINRDSTIRALENKLDTLKQIKAIVYAEGQQDKVKNHRRTTLLEYRKRLEDCDIQIEEHATFVDKMKAMNGYIPRKVSIANAPKLGQKAKSSRVQYSLSCGSLGNISPLQQHVKSVSYLRNRHPTPRYPIDLKQLEEVNKVLSESKQTDSQSDKQYDWIVDSPFLYKLEKINESNEDSTELPDESELNDEIIQTQKDLDRARCCFGF